MVKSRKSQARKIVTIGCALAIIGVIGVIIYFAIDVVRSISQDAGGDSRNPEVPAILGLSSEEAELALRNAGFKPDQRESAVSEDVEAGLVLRQDPEAGRRKKPGSKVKYYISLGNPHFVVPDIVGKDFAEALRLLEEARLKPGRIDRMYVPGGSARRVLSQNPQPGKEFPDSISVDLQVADNAALPDVSMPDLSGQLLSSVEELLVHSNLHLSQVDYVANNSVAAGTVLSQNVAAGQSVKLGSNVGVTVAAPSELISSWTRSLSVRIPITGGPSQQQVKIKVFDQIAQNTVVYDDVHTTGSFVDQQIALEGKATVMIYIQDMEHPWREERIPYQKADEQ